jgi:hypothetical protein
MVAITVVEARFGAVVAIRTAVESFTEAGGG